MIRYRRGRGVTWREYNLRLVDSIIDAVHAGGAGNGFEWGWGGRAT